MSVVSQNEKLDWQIEHILLSGIPTDDTGKRNNFSDDIEKLLQGQYWCVLSSHSSDNFIQLLQASSNFEKEIHKIIEIETSVRQSWFCIGIASLCYFVQCNWVGPRANLMEIDWLAGRREEALKILSSSEECNQNVKMPELLYLAKVIFSNKCLQDAYAGSLWWLFRANLLHQRILDEKLACVFQETEDLILRIDALNLLKNPYYEALFNLEAAHFYLTHKRPESSGIRLERVQNAAKITVSLHGAMGKRTKYQQEDKAQLLLNVQLGKATFPSEGCHSAPTSIDLDDDLRLERIQFSEEVCKAELGALEEAFILSKGLQLRQSQPRDKLTDEESNPYLSTVIDSTNNWSLKMTALYYRCLLESNDKRSVERSMLQAEHLLNELDNPDVPARNRHDIFFASGMKPAWKLEEMWANLMFSLGLTKGSLEIFVKLHLWENVITCYNILDLKHKAAEIIQQELAKRPTVKLWCLLGDATQNESHYETAWKLSGERSSRAQRHWGLYHFDKKNYTEAIPHLTLSGELNNIQERVWIRLGYAALQTEDWKLAATAYRRYCALEQTTYEAWNNLAKAYIKLGEKARAYKALQDAVKCNYDRWEIWDNLMVVSVDLGHFSEVIRCYHRILDLKNQHIDIEILNILTKAMVDDIGDSDGNSSRKLLLPKVLELFGRIASSPFASNNSMIWSMYAELVTLKKTDVDNERAAQYLQRAYRAAVSNPKWYQAVETTTDVLDLCENLTEACLRCARSSTDDVKRKALLGSAKLSLQSILKKVKDLQWEDANVISRLTKVDDHLKHVIEELGRTTRQAIN